MVKTNPLVGSGLEWVKLGERQVVFSSDLGNYGALYEHFESGCDFTGYDLVKVVLRGRITINDTASTNSHRVEIHVGTDNPTSSGSERYVISLHWVSMPASGASVWDGEKTVILQGMESYTSGNQSRVSAGTLWRTITGAKDAAFSVDDPGKITVVRDNAAHGQRRVSLTVEYYGTTVFS